MTSSKDIKAEIIETGKTDDEHKDTVFEARYGSSYAHGCVSKDMIFVWLVRSETRGDMKEMLNAIVRKYGINQIKFTSVLNDNLLCALKGFTPSMELHEQMGEYIPCLTGEWKL